MKRSLIDIGLDVGYNNAKPLRAGFSAGGWCYADGVSSAL
jgi:hypothetical protein